MDKPNKYSISAFFPCYNDKGTIATIVLETKSVLEKLTDDFEIIVIDDGSTDGSRDLLMTLQREVSQLRLVLHDKNKGYGGALRSGFAAAAKDLIFYTDGDGQYDVKELPKLLEKLTPEVDVINGYKIKRNDPFYRVIVGYIYQYFVKITFGLKIKDVDCDFRLIRKRAIRLIKLESNTGTICVELVKKIELGGYKFSEVGVSHYNRTYGSSQFFTPRRVLITMYRLLLLWLDFFIFRKPEKRSNSI